MQEPCFSRTSPPPVLMLLPWAEASSSPNHPPGPQQRGESLWEREFSAWLVERMLDLRMLAGLLRHELLVLSAHQLTFEHQLCELVCATLCPVGNTNMCAAIGHSSYTRAQANARKERVV